jgi:hypothetical protein
MSLTGFMKKWAESARVPGLSMGQAFEMQEDLQKVVEYAGGTVEKSFEPTPEEAALGLLHPREEESRRKLEYQAFLAGREARKYNQSELEARTAVLEGQVVPPAGPATVDTPQGPASASSAARGGRRPA